MGREDQAAAFIKRKEDEYGLGWARPVCEALSDYLVHRKNGEYAGLDRYFPVLESLLRDHSQV